MMDTELTKQEDAEDRIEVFNKIITDLNVRWHAFDQLFSNQTNLAILDRTGRAFWDFLWSLMLDDLFLSISRLFDPPQENLSLREVVSFKEVQAIRSSLQKRVDEMEPDWKKGMKVWRNKRIAHWDKKTALGEHKLPEVLISEVKQLVGGINAFARAVNIEAHHHDIDFQLSPTGWGLQVLSYLKLGIEKKNDQLRAKYPQALYQPGRVPCRQSVMVTITNRVLS
jgi:hypothetical protein